MTRNIFACLLLLTFTVSQGSSKPQIDLAPILVSAIKIGTGVVTIPLDVFKLGIDVTGQFLEQAVRNTLQTRQERTERSAHNYEDGILEIMYAVFEELYNGNCKPLLVKEIDVFDRRDPIFSQKTCSNLKKILDDLDHLEYTVSEEKKYN